VDAECEEGAVGVAGLVPLVPVVAGGEPGGEVAGCPGMTAAAGRGVADPVRGNDLFSVACAAAADQIAKTGEVARGQEQAAAGPRRAFQVDGDPGMGPLSGTIVLDSEALTRTGSVIQSFFDKSGRRRLR